MVDVMSFERRSALMSRIRANNTRPEIELRKRLWHAGYRYRLHGPKLPGRPDIVLAKWRVAIFVHGCFWHRHEGCPLFRLPKTRQEFWDQKLRANQVRDIGTTDRLIHQGWRVAVVWECSLGRESEKSVATLADWIEGGSPTIEI